MVPTWMEPSYGTSDMIIPNLCELGGEAETSLPVAEGGREGGEREGGREGGR